MQRYRCHTTMLFVVTVILHVSLFTTGTAALRCHATTSFDAVRTTTSTRTQSHIGIDADVRNQVTGVTLKLAVDTAGGVACRKEVKPERFTSPASLDMVHRLRATADAVLVGVGTVLADDPSLLVRRNVPYHRQPLRVVIDPSLKMIAEDENPDKPNYQLLTDGYPTVIYHRQIKIPSTVPISTTLIYLDSKFPVDDPQSPLSSQFVQGISVDSIIDDLSDRFGVRHLMVEGGPVTAKAFLEANRVDRCIVVNAPVTFPEPILSGISDEVLCQSLSRLGTFKSGVDTVECWTRPALPWPTDSLDHWP